MIDFLFSSSEMIKCLSFSFGKVPKVRGAVIKSFYPKLCCYTTSASQKMKSAPMPKFNTDTAIVWMDLEMTGLNVRTDKIMEVACLITDKNLNVLTEGLDVAIKHPEEVFANMNDWCMQHHYESGLVQKCMESDVTPEMAEPLLLEYLQSNVPKSKCPLAGNSVYMDRLFLGEHMPLVNDYLHYRIIDVSTIKELCRRWNPHVSKLAPKKELRHRSLDDIQESIKELKYYRENLFKIS